MCTFICMDSNNCTEPTMIIMMMTEDFKSQILETGGKKKVV